MGKVQKVYAREFKQEAVRLAQTSGKPIVQVARETFVSRIPPSINGVLNVNEKSGSARITAAALAYSVSSPPSLWSRICAVLAR